MAKTKVQHLFRYVPSGMMFARFKIRGKQVKRSLGMTNLELARRKLDEFKRQAMGDLEPLPWDLN